jgi:hypothetical protein
MKVTKMAIHAPPAAMLMAMTAQKEPSDVGRTTRVTTSVSLMSCRRK